MKKDRQKIREIACERIDILLIRARKKRLRDPKISIESVKAARNISSRTNVRIQKNQTFFFCKKCNSYHSSKSMRYRTNPKQKRIVRTCLVCKHKKYYPFRR